MESVLRRTARCHPNPLAINPSPRDQDDQGAWQLDKTVPRTHPFTPSHLRVVTGSTWSMVHGVPIETLPSNRGLGLSSYIVNNIGLWKQILCPHLECDFKTFSWTWSWKTSIFRLYCIVLEQLITVIATG